MSRVMDSAALREAFLAYFAGHEHRRLPGSGLIPADDPSLLFTNAGMVQFKEVFLGRRQAPAPRAVTAQPCLRAGGKHNDLENVGFTNRHHTFFEMLGNFSFGDYFKAEAIHYAWQFLTGELGLSPQRLWVTVHEQDQEAERLWLEEQAVAPERFRRLGDEDNFWSMGDTGPCGPCTEIFYDHGPEVAGGPPGSGAEGGRYVEIWNLVFMQYQRDAAGRRTPLPSPAVDTGMGLERLAAVMAGSPDNYHGDLFRGLIEAAAEVVGCRPDFASPSLRVLADHIRAAAFLIGEGLDPANEGRSYVLRRILRRAILHGRRLGAGQGFFHRLTLPLVGLMGGAYPMVAEQQSRIERVIRAEEEQFAGILEQGSQMLERELERLSGPHIPGELAFRLYDTYGFPIELLGDVAREKGPAASGSTTMSCPDWRAGLRLRATMRCPPGCRSVPCFRAGMRWRCWRPAPRAWWCWSRRPSMPRGAVRSATAASCGPGRGILWWRTPSARGSITCTGAACCPAGCGRATGWRPGWMPAAVRPPPVIIRPLTCCMPHCAVNLESMSASAARWWSRSGCALTSPIRSR